MKGECIKCGLCKANAPVHKVLLKEAHTARGMASLIQEGKLDSKIFYADPLDEGYKVICPTGVDLEIADIRRQLVEKGVTTTANKKIVESLKKFGNPFGIDPNAQE